MVSTSVKRRELVTLAKPINKAKKPNVAGWLISEKLDGTRCFWDGGLTRGLPTEHVPWAGLLNPKTLKPKDKIKPISTGLWSRLGNPIIAPEWFLDQLPPVLLDGELWAGRGNFQECRSIVSGDTADDRWEKIKYMIYGAPSLETMTIPGLIKNPTYYCEIKESALQNMMHRICDMEMSIIWCLPETTFRDALTELHEYIHEHPFCQVHLQRFLSEDSDRAWSDADVFLEGVLAQGGEGAIIRNPDALYEIKRTSNLLKYKPYDDDEGTLVGFTAGRGKYEGKIGALILDYKGQRLELSGMTDDERGMTSEAFADPGKDMPDFAVAKHFTIGQQITFKYRELSDDGIPKEARYFRPREES